MIRLATLQVLITSILLSSNNHPIILVHGFLGWGKEEVGDKNYWGGENDIEKYLNDRGCLLYTSPSPRDTPISRMPSSA